MDHRNDQKLVHNRTEGHVTDHDHDHGYGHDHGHCHDHGCDHDHDHDHDNTAQMEEGLSITSHESARIGALRCRIPGAYDDVLKQITMHMEHEAAAIEEEGGLIGHVKAFIREENRSCMISITEAGDMHINDTVQPAVFMEHTAIVFGLEEDELRMILEKEFSSFL